MRVSLGAAGTLPAPLPLAAWPSQKVLLAQPRGFCAGVEMAIKALAWMVRIFEPPVYCYHEIVHNRLVVERFEALGVVFVDDIDEVPADVPLMLSAHGSAPEVVEAARAKGRFVVNAVCPLVTKVHHEAKVRAGKGYTILYVGHAGHDEAVGTLAVAPESIRLVEHEEDVDHVLRRGRATRRRSRCSPRPPSPSTTGRASPTGPAASSPSCGPRPATTSASRPPTGRRRSRRSPPEADAVVVIGSANSSNTVALAKVAAHRRVPDRAADRRSRRARPRRRSATRASSASPPVRARPRISSQEVIEQLAPRRRRRARPRHRRGRVLPSAARAARAAPRARLARRARVRRRSRGGAGGAPARSPTTAPSTRR